jgi:hypothetical protein
LIRRRSFSPCDEALLFELGACGAQLVYGDGATKLMYMFFEKKFYR